MIQFLWYNDFFSINFRSAPSLPVVSKIVSTAPDLQPKQPSPLPQEDAEMEVGGAEGAGQGEEPAAAAGADEGEDSESDDDDVQITIGEITAAPGASYNRTPSYSRMSMGATCKFRERERSLYSSDTDLTLNTLFSFSLCSWSKCIGIHHQESGC